MTEQELAAIKDRLVKATPGPWSYTWLDGLLNASGGAIAWVSGNDDVALEPDDADLIAHAPTDLATLVAEVERLRATTPTPRPARATDARVTRGHLVVSLDNGAELRAPLEWFPRLLHASLAEQSRWQAIGDGVGLRWPELDVDVSVAALLGLPDE